MKASTMPSTRLKIFNSQVQRALFAFQMIEEALKAYLADAHEVVRASIPNGIRFKVESSQYESAPLERLLTYFAMFSANRTLIKRLNGLREDRNFCAHRAFALGFMKAATRHEDLGAEIQKVVDIEAAADEALQLLQAEREAMRALRTQVARPKGSMAAALRRAE